MSNYHKLDHAVMREQARKRYIKEHPEYENNKFDFQIMSDFDGSAHVAVWPIPQGSVFELQYSFSQLEQDMLAAHLDKPLTKNPKEDHHARKMHVLLR